jgi:hypothetical protein
MKHPDSCEVSDSHGGDYEGCGLLGYKNPDRTSQETYYVSATKPIRVMLCKIGGFHGGDYEECLPLGRDAVWFFLKNRRYGGTYRLNHQGYKNRRARNSVSSN